MGDGGDDASGFPPTKRLGLTRRRAVSPRSPFLPALALASAQSPLSHSSGWGSVQAPPSCTLPAHIIPSHPKTKTRPDQPSHQNHHSGSPSQGTVLQPDSLLSRHVVTFSSQPRNGPRGLLSSSLCVLGCHQSHLCHTAPVPSHQHVLPCQDPFHTLGSLHRDSRHIE